MARHWLGRGYVFLIIGHHWSVAELSPNTFRSLAPALTCIRYEAAFIADEIEVSRSLTLKLNVLTFFVCGGYAATQNMDLQFLISGLFALFTPLYLMRANHTMR